HAERAPAGDAAAALRQAAAGGQRGVALAGERAVIQFHILRAGHVQRAPGLMAAAEGHPRAICANRAAGEAVPDRQFPARIQLNVALA
ncbi:hypothetical protein, partial [Enterobacter asburiae]|uniref:hypothetical protein n=1 Tax=Enterobacter asburiae TaxID=61645 RepID=UPI00402ADC6A